MWTLPNLNLDMLSMQTGKSVKNRKQNGKQCRSWIDGSLLAVSSGSTLFAKVFVLVYMVERVNFDDSRKSRDQSSNKKTTWWHDACTPSNLKKKKKKYIYIYIYIYMKIRGICDNHVAQPSRVTERTRNKEQIMRRDNDTIAITGIYEYTKKNWNRGAISRRTTRGEGGGDSLIWIYTGC